MGEEFLDSVRHHKLTVKLDRGVHRHLHFQNPECGHRWFTLTTWPNYLTISGDMGTYVFHRSDDLFPLFRWGDRQAINPQYWEGKCEAADKYSKIKTFSSRRFRHAVYQAVKDESRSVRRAAYDDLFWLADLGEYEALEAVRNFDHDDFQFDLYDFGEESISEFTYHYIWCCHAIVWGINQYDRTIALRSRWWGGDIICPIQRWFRS